MTCECEVVMEYDGMGQTTSKACRVHVVLTAVVPGVKQIAAAYSCDHMMEKSMRKRRRKVGFIGSRESLKRRDRVEGEVRSLGQSHPDRQSTDADISSIMV